MIVSPKTRVSGVGGGGVKGLRNREGTPISNGRGCLLYLLVTLSLFTLKRSTVGAFAVPFRV